MMRISKERLDLTIRKLDPEEKATVLAEKRERYAEILPEEKAAVLAKRRERERERETERERCRDSSGGGEGSGVGREDREIAAKLSEKFG
jgi:hypothetical protein